VPDESALGAALPGLRFTMTINGAPLDLTPYPLVRLRLRDGTHCAWVGVISLTQRASENHFAYTIERPAAAGAPPRTDVELLVVFKDP
jgi:hypothetical protein